MLKSTKLRGKLATTKKWIEEYEAFKNSKDFHSTYNGRRVFSETKGELSVTMLMQRLGLSRTAVMYYITSGKLKTFRKGFYHVTTEKELARFLAVNKIQEKIA